ncbi:hypothetical protein SAMN05660733_02629 [Lentzea albidocapillata]|uniref:Uncharacterized protein n=1 Tax=Lentzea albidocapillata TaxID=40571 RepID=A0A1W2D171_9PSEU|nr:hypothetical protein SAMN05660733_02629 [Lentzea albidocapillata]
MFVSLGSIMSDAAFYRVVVPQTPEQAANADRVAELGLSERVDDHADLRAAGVILSRGLRGA